MKELDNQTVWPPVRVGENLEGSNNFLIEFLFTICLPKKEQLSNLFNLGIVSDSIHWILSNRFESFKQIVEFFEYTQQC